MSVPKIAGSNTPIVSLGAILPIHASNSGSSVISENIVASCEGCNKPAIKYNHVGDATLPMQFAAFGKHFANHVSVLTCRLELEHL